MNFPSLPKIKTLAITLSILITTGCGVTSSGQPGLPKVPAPSVRTLNSLFGSTIVKTHLVRWSKSPAEDLVATKQGPTNASTQFQHLEVSVLRWSPKYHNWNIIWNSRPLSLQQGFTRGHPVTPALSTWKTIRDGQNGVLVGVLDPSSLGASNTFNNAQLLWIPSHGQPRTLWFATGTHSLMDGAISRKGEGLSVTENACWSVMAKTNAHSNPVVTHPSCSSLLAQTSGKHLSFTLSGSTIMAQHSSITVPVGSTVVFQPLGQKAKYATNHDDLVLLGNLQSQPGNQGTVLNDLADTFGFWSYTFRFVGTYEFAIATASFIQTGVNPPTTWTIHATAKN